MKNFTSLSLTLLLSGSLFLSSCGGDDDEMPAEEVDMTASMIAGSWVLEPAAGAFAVGPTALSGEYYSASADDVTARACQFDDVYTFGEDGSFSIDMGDETYLEEWQAGANECGTPVAPHNGAGSYTFTATTSSLVLEGQGAFIGLAKAVNGSELSSNDGVPTTRTYTIASLDAESTPKKMTVYIPVGTGLFWTFKLVSK